MTRSTPFRSAFTKASIGVFAAAVLVFAPSVTIAQHGGSHAGGGGGGHTGGGGFGGGSHSSGSSRASAPAPSHSAPRPSTHSAPVTTPAPVSTASTNAAVKTAPSLVGTPGAVKVGTSATPQTEVLGFARVGEQPWQTSPSRAGAVSFTGQGHRLWQDSPSAASSASNRILLGHPQATGRPLPPHRVFLPPAPVIFVPAFEFFGPGFFGNGFGCDPFWGFNFNPVYDPAFGCNGFGYGFGYGGFGYGGYYGSGYGYNFGSGYGNSGYSSPDNGASYDWKSDSSGEYGPFSVAGPPSDDSRSTPPSLQQSPDSAAGNESTSTAAAPVPSSTAIYLKDGSSYDVMSYWLDAGKLHYITNYGGETTIEMDQLDLQRTVDENAQHGVTFTLRPAPAAPAPDASPADASPAADEPPTPNVAPAPQQ
jgi:hypothetical protein